MSEMSEFRQGDRVRHASVGEGVVTQDGCPIRVQYDQVSSRGHRAVGVYDALWFRLHGALLVRLSSPAIHEE